MPVDRAMSSDLFSVSFYRQELARQEIEKEDEDDSAVVEFGGPRMDIFQVYTLTSVAKVTWLDQSQLHQDMVKDMYQKWIAQSDLARKQQKELKGEEDAE